MSVSRTRRPRGRQASLAAFVIGAVLASTFDLSAIAPRMALLMLGATRGHAVAAVAESCGSGTDAVTPDSA